MMSEEVGKAVMVGVGEARHQIEMGLTSNRRLIRATKNPMDKCTVVSIFPKAIKDEYKPTIEPGKFSIDAGSIENPAILVVGSSSWWKDVDLDQPMLEMQRSSIEIANSIINDYCNGMLGCNMSDAVPGLFFVLGAHTMMEIKMQYKSKLEEVNAKQNNWYRILVRLADSLWSRTNGNPLVICEEMKLAAKQLNFNDKPWLRDFVMSQQVQCKACGSLKNPSFPVCMACKSVDLEHPDAKNLKFIA